MIKRCYEIVKKYFSLKANNTKRVVLLFISALLKDLSLLLFPIFAARILDSAIVEDYREAFLNVIFLSISYLLRIVLHHWNYNEYAKIRNDVYTQLQNKVTEKIGKYKDNFDRDISKYYIINTITDDIIATATILDTTFDSIARFINLVISLVIILTYDVYIGLIALVLNLIYFYYINIFTKKRDLYRKGQRDRQDKIVSFFAQVLDGNKEIKSYNMKDGLRTYLDEKLDDWKEQYTLKRVYHDIKQSLFPLIIVVGKMLMYLITIISILNGNSTIGVLILLLGYYKRIEKDSDELNKMVNDLCGNSVKLDRVYNVINYKNKDLIEFGMVDNTNVMGVIGFEKVSFSYNDGKVLKNLNFNIYNNKITTIVGESGSGKSSIFKLLLRLREVDKGNIYIDNTNIYEYSKQAYPNIVSVVVQKPFIFNMSIKDNLGLINSNFEDIVDVCKKVGMHEYISELPNGYNTILKEDGTNVSGGQKQLLSIARMLLTKSKILLFDEVTTALDVNTERQILELLKKISKDHTILIITHKPKLMKISDDILVIKKGKLIDRGNYDYLNENNEYFKGL